MNVPHSFGKLDREFDVGVAHVCAILPTQVADSEVSPRCNHLYHGHKYLPYTGKYKAQYRMLRRNISRFVVAQLLKGVVWKGSYVDTGIPSHMYNRKACESWLDFLPLQMEHSPEKEW